MTRISWWKMEYGVYRKDFLIGRTELKYALKYLIMSLGQLFKECEKFWVEENQHLRRNSHSDTDFRIGKCNILSKCYELNVSGKGRKLSVVSENMLYDSKKSPVCVYHCHHFTFLVNICFGGDSLSLTCWLVWYWHPMRFGHWLGESLSRHSLGL